MSPSVKIQFVEFIAAIALCLFSIWQIDDPIARSFAGPAQQFHATRFAIGVYPFLIPIAVATLYSGLHAICARTLKYRGKAVILSGISATFALGVTDYVLKPIFGRQTVYYYLANPHLHGFIFMTGDYRASFPSGHMAVAAAVFTVCKRYYPRWQTLYAVAVTIVGIVLVAGEWHYVSDTVAGIAVGVGISRLFMLCSQHFPLLTTDD